MSQEEKRSRRRLYGFIIINVIEEAIIATIAFVVLSVFVPWLILPGMIVVVFGLVIFTLVKIYSYWTSAYIPVYDPLIGQEGVALSDFREIKSDVWVGRVRVRGEVWNAQSQNQIRQNSPILVEGVDGLTLKVTLIERNNL
ncbi:MAG: NfeD family protein [Candidatus Hermodarchaeota archaeon]|jgi:membrane-bound ClpP family serine protease|nr:NfeD family protein [Candidatus Hermodarchaeota archaeon]